MRLFDMEVRFILLLRLNLVRFFNTELISLDSKANYCNIISFTNRYSRYLKYVIHAYILW